MCCKSIENLICICDNYSVNIMYTCCEVIVHLWQIFRRCVGKCEYNMNKVIRPYYCHVDVYMKCTEIQHSQDNCIWAL